VLLTTGRPQFVNNHIGAEKFVETIVEIGSYQAEDLVNTMLDALRIIRE